MTRFAWFSRSAVAALALVCLAGVAGPSHAASIGFVVVLPPAPLDQGTATLRTDLEYPTSGYAEYDASLVYETAMSVVVNLFVSAPAAGEPVALVLTSEIVDVPLGTVFAGHYDFTVNLVEVPRDTLIPHVTATATGGFDVVPEPAVLPLAVGLFALLGTRRRAS